MVTVDTTAPRYRYITTDLLTNTVLAEIPFQGVTYARGLKTAGAFSGSLMIIPGATDGYNLYDSTMPGQTGLYVMRDDQCVWGGMVWSRDYDLVTKQLQVQGQEFTSYLHHRNIWKTFNSDYGAKITVVTGTDYMTITLDSGSFGTMGPGSKVQILFTDASLANHNGHYEVLQQLSSKVLRVRTEVGGVTVNHTKYSNKVVKVWTTGAHGFEVGDRVRMSIPGKNAAYQGDRIVTKVQRSNTFSYAPKGAKDTKTYNWKKASGVAALDRVVPVSTGTGHAATVRIRTDTYDYIRSLVQAAFQDFSGIEFATGNAPGVGYEIDVTAYKQTHGYTTITTAEPHDLAEGQQVRIENLDSRLNGEWEVTSVPSETTFTYKNPGTPPFEGSIAASTYAVTKRMRTPVAAKTTEPKAAAYSVITLTTAAAHGWKAGDYITTSGISDANNDGYNLKVTTRQIATIPTTTSLTYTVKDTAVTRVAEKIKNAPAGATVAWRPFIVVGSYGSFARNADIGIAFEGDDMMTDIVTLSIGAPCVVATTEPHGLAIGRGVYFTTTGAVPTGIKVNTVYYVASIPTPRTLTLVDQVGGSVIATSGTQSGTHSITTSGVYSGQDVKPGVYRGGEVENLGDALDSYSETMSGFEYRVDCTYDPDTRSFTRTFKLLQIDVPNPPEDGEVSPLSRFGADKLIFSHPGNISSMNITESAENAATRFFVTGSTAGAEGNPYYAAATATDLLTPPSGGRAWPILEDRESMSDEADQTVLYQKAEKYLREAKPPIMTFNISVNGSIDPVIGTYQPGDWCAVVTDDDFVRMRLQSKLEPRDTAIVRKIQAIEVSVPDGVAFPENVSLTLVAEWEIDTSAE